ncbi:hypothetical protein D9M71_381810 [compost metagenome]
MVAAFGFDDFTVVRVFVLLDLARALGAGGLYRATRGFVQFGFWIQQRNDVTQGLRIFAHQCTQFAFELQLGLQLVVLRQVLQTRLQFFDGFFCGAVFVDQGHEAFLGNEGLERQCGNNNQTVPPSKH